MSLLNSYFHSICEVYGYSNSLYGDVTRLPVQSKFLFVWLLHLRLSGKRGSTSSYATAGIVCDFFIAHKPTDRDKVKIPLKMMKR
jgi:hypothetical protein